MITDFRHTAEKLERRIDEIASYVYRERAPISGWRVGPASCRAPKSPRSTTVRGPSSVRWSTSTSRYGSGRA